MSAETWLLLVLLGVGVGAFGTLVGAGGGSIVTPVLLLLYPSTSAATVTAIALLVVFFNAASGSLAYMRQRRIDYRSGVAFALATLPGSVLGALLVTAVSRRLFDILMAAALAALAAWLLTGPRVRAERDAGRGALRVIIDRAGTEYRYRVRMLPGVVYTAAVGFFATFLGIGGGVIHVPLLINALGFPVHIATATSHFVLANMSAVATVTHAVDGSLRGGDGLQRALALSVGAVPGAQLGALISERVPGLAIKRLLAAALAGLAIRLLVGAL
jgi:uncharacterized protein